ncbi:MAG: adenylate/guanylate cyclase domain-containing protein, partial [Bacteroidales bacterium]|nr:adenylate/guanylate cyclase domain-containing protein [Bacteroidales bacterium]
MQEHRKLAAIMFTDITGYSALMSADEKYALNVLKKNKSIHIAAIAKYNGEYIKEVGDGTLAVFSSSLDAVGCALEIQKATRKEPSLKIRIGIHSGDVVVRDGDVFGDSVNIGSRIEAAGEPGGIYISEKVYDDIKNISGIKTMFFGERTLKNIPQPVKIYSVDASSSLSVKRIISAHPIKRMVSSVPDQKEKRVKIKLYSLLAGIVTLIFTIIALWLFVIPEHNPDQLKNRIVVAPFENRTGEAQLDELGSMVADWLTQGLSRLEKVMVVPTSTVMQFSGVLPASQSSAQKSDYLMQLARDTKAGILVSGSYYLQQEKIQFQTEVKNVMDGSLIYTFPVVTGSYQKPTELIEKMNNEVIGVIAYYFNIPSFGLSMISKPPKYDAYSEYFVGLELFGLNDEEAIEHFIQATKLDSLFLVPHLLIAAILGNNAEYARADSVLQILNQKREQLTTFERNTLDRNIARLKGNNYECFRFLLLNKEISPEDWITNYLIGLYGMYLNKPAITVKTYANLNFPNRPRGTVAVIWQRSVLIQALHLLGDYQQEMKEAR